MSQGVQQSGVFFVSNKTSPASDLIFEEYLKKCMTRTTSHPFKADKTQKAVRVQHSPFGDFPKDKMPKKQDIEEPEPIDMYASSIAIKGNSKSGLLYSFTALGFIATQFAYFITTEFYLNLFSNFIFDLLEC